MKKTRIWNKKFNVLSPLSSDYRNTRHTHSKPKTCDCWFDCFRQTVGWLDRNNPRAHAEPTMRSRVAVASTWVSAFADRVLPSTAPVAEPRWWHSNFHPSRRHLRVQSASEAGKLKSIDDLPGPSLAATLYWLFIKGYADKSHLLQVLFSSFLVTIYFLYDIFIL